jgi:hypothetical protein
MTQGLLVRINGSQSIEAVQRDLLQAIAKISKRRAVRRSLDQDRNDSTQN